MHGVQLDPQRLLQDVFQLETFRPGQREVIARLLAGLSAVAIFPTGAGKSLCYQLPALALQGLTLVVSPLIALMKDQIDALKARRVAAARLDSTLDKEAVREIHAELRAGRLKLLYVAPERLNNERFLQTLSGLELSLMAVDEAHCISEWGHNFRPDYLKLPGLARELGIPRVVALTATATPAVAEGIARAFSIPLENIVRTPLYRSNLTLRMEPGPAASRDQRLMDSLRSLPPGPTIVYVTLQRTAQEVAARLGQAGFEARAYHAGLPAEERSQVQEWFMASERAVVVATIAFGMGIDKSDIRTVLHYNLPKTVENYAQEIGRAGRDGQASTCLCLAAPEDIIALENFTLGDTPTREALHSLLGELAAMGEELDLSPYEVSTRHDIRPLVVDTVLTYLELDGLLRSTGAFYTEYKLRWLSPRDKMLARFDAARQDFLQRLFALAVDRRIWSLLDVHQAAINLGESRERILRALNYLEEQGHLELQVAGVRQGYRKLAAWPAQDELVDAMLARFEQREQNDLSRLGAMKSLSLNPGCTTSALLAYFGEQSDRDQCDHCGVCSGNRPGPVALSPPTDLSESQRELLRRVHDAGLPALTHPRQLARFLCGIASPQANRARLSGRSEFGALSQVPFQVVLASAESQIRREGSK